MVQIVIQLIQLLPETILILRLAFRELFVVGRIEGVRDPTKHATDSQAEWHQSQNDVNNR